MRTVNFTIHNMSLNFSHDKSVSLSFELIGWAWRNKQVKHIVWGEFDGNLTINASKIQFYTEDRKPPHSECFTVCLPGQIRQMKGFHFCCYDCIDCESGTFRSSSDDSTCTPCPQHQWSPPRSTQCYDRREKYLFWSEPGTAALLFILCFALMLVGFTGVLFVNHFRTPAVQATGGGLSLVGLFSLFLLCVSIIFQIGKPSCTFCMLCHLSLGLCINLCYSPIVVKALQILLAHDFPDSRPNVLHRLIRKHPWALVAWSFLVEAALGLIYLYCTPARLFENYSVLPTEVLFQCYHPSWFVLFLLHGHNGALAFFSFLCTFMVQSPPKKYNTARAITFAMITYFITLVVTIPSFTTAKPIYHPAIMIVAILSGALGVLATYYLPKCYILWFKPEWNTWDYFQDYTKENLQEKDARD